MLQLKSQGGVTLVELMIGIAILGFLLAIGIPNMSHWMLSNKARAASEFYAEGFGMARRQALSHNARSRLQLTANEKNGQMDWQVDICFPTAFVACNAGSGVWSTTENPAAGDPEGVNGYKSVFRNADALPPASVLVPSVLPEGSSAVYFTEVGWVDTTFNSRLTRIRLTPTADYVASVPEVALSITLAGMASKCDPTKTGNDSRACPP